MLRSIYKNGFKRYQPNRVVSGKPNALNKNIIYTYSIDKMSDKMKRNHLLRQLLANVTDAELEKLLNFRQTITNNSLDKNA